MAKRKTIPFVWICPETKMINGSGRAKKEQIKEMKRNKYSPKLQKVTEHFAKPVKKGGTKALANAK
jgi:hypothetical protein